MVMWYMPKNTKDLIHYILVYSALLVSWVPMMNYFNNNVWMTSFGGLVIFYVADKIAHHVLKVD